jgi:penicillin-binding protein 1C
MAGSFRYGVPNYGYNNGATALRSPGSTLKPFAYSLALERGFTTSTLLSDVERVYTSPGGDYFPANFDRNAYGPVTMRTALGNSLNLSAIRLLNLLGYDDLYHFLTRIDLINDRSKGPDYYGLGLIVGNPEVTLVQLAAAYAMLANDGHYRPVRYLVDEPTGPDEWVLNPETAYIITDILSDPGARTLTFGANERLAFPFPVAFKTGTSTRYRDCWIIGYTKEFTVGIWTGNFDNAPTTFQSGASASGPVFKDVVNLLYRHGAPSPFRKPENVREFEVCSYSGMKPTPNCPQMKREIFISGTEPRVPSSFHLARRSKNYLDTGYAGWLFEKKLKNAAGSYRLRGFGDDLDSVFELPNNPSEETGQRTNIGMTTHQPSNEHRRPLRSRRLEITEPHDGDRFMLHPRLPDQSIKLAASLNHPAPSVTWYIDGMEYSTTPPPYQVYWTLEKGEHTVTAVDPVNIADSVTIMVE